MIELKIDGKIVGYNIGDNVHISNNLSDINNWYLTIGILDIVKIPICSKDCSKEEIARYVNVILSKIRNKVDSLKSDVIPFT